MRFSHRPTHLGAHNRDCEQPIAKEFDSRDQTRDSYLSDKFKSFRQLTGPNHHIRESTTEHVFFETGFTKARRNGEYTSAENGHFR
jgi:hypothetical protein